MGDISKGGALNLNMKSFVKANNVDEIVKYKSELGNKARIIAGGTDLMVRVNNCQEKPECFLYIGEAGLNYIREEENDIVIGSATTLTELLNSELISKNLPMLKTAVSKMASVAVRNMATIGGNICNASPAADTAVPLLTLNARLKLLSSKGERVVNISEFFKGPGKVSLNEDEFLKEIIVPKQGNAKWAYRKLGRRKADTLSVVSGGVLMELENGLCKDVRIALGAVGPTPVLAVKTSDILRGKKVDQALIEEAANKVVEEISPIDDQRCSKWYRNRASKAILKDLLGQVLN